jgi:probable HAF family extracellular repeat protein
MDRHFLHAMAAATALLGALQAQADVPRYRAETLPVLNAVQDPRGISYPTAMNNAGQITGGSGFGDPSATRESPFLYSGGELLRLTTGPTGRWVGAGMDINERGDVAGLVGDPSGSSIGYRPFLYRDGQLKELGDPTARVDGEARGLNNLGHVTGVFDRKAFFYDGKAMRFLEGMPATPEGSSIGMGVNDHDVVVGTRTADEAGGAPWEAFMYSGGHATALPGLGGSYTAPERINNAGQVAGNGITAAGEAHAFLYSGGKTTDLGTFGGISSFASDLNEAGWVVGTADGPSNNDVGFLYAEGQLHRLRDLLAPGSQQWRIGGADAITDDGRILARAINQQKEFSYLLLTPVPEPGALALALAGLGLVTLAARKRGGAAG